MTVQIQPSNEPSQTNQIPNAPANPADVTKDTVLGTTGKPEEVSTADPIGDTAISSFKEFEAAHQAAEAAGVGDLFAAPDKVDPAKAVEPPKEPAVEPPKVETPPPPKPTARERINQLTRQKGDTERELENARARIRELESAPPKPAAAAPTPNDAPAGPNANDKNADGTDKYPFGELDTAYVKDLARHEALQLVREERTREAQERQQQAASVKAAEAEEKWADQLESAVKEHPDFVEKVMDGARAGSWVCSKETGELIEASEVGAKLMYHLATNPNEAAALHKIKDPVEHARAFGRLEARIESASASPPPPPPHPVPRAAPPVEQVRGVNGQYAANDATEDFKSFEAKWQPQLDKQQR